MIFIAAIFMTGCITPETEQPAGDLSVSELLEEPVYDTELSVYGRVSLLGELFCPCFELTSEGETVQVWYGLMVEDDGRERPSVSVEGIENGDWVVVTGELKTAGTHRAQNDFWASSIEKYDRSGEDQAREIATNYVMNMDDYRIYNGRNLAVE